MGTDNDLNLKIREMESLIQDKYPELQKFVEEMTETNPDESHPDMESEMKDYYQSLKSMVDRYEEEKKLKDN
jgi:hypothetical protein